jgi:hypothetical protein
MYSRFALIAVAALTSATAFAAEPVKPVAHQPSQPQRASSQVVLASADDVRAPAPAEQQASTPAKPHRFARVTTCRCGDAAAAQPDSEQ